MKSVTKTAAQTKSFGKKLAAKVKDGGVVCLIGELGAGKTTLVQGLAQGLGIRRRISSPTFIIARKYNHFWHIDLYRLQNKEEAEAIGIREILADPKNIVVIEWPEIIKNALPKHYWEVKISIIGETQREIEMSST
ncbi:tRNA (adenosine(37)-N6)-threonylcarbamoyltransferase complex ATPase subunit type 1 TsaE [Patescibacteria group bacterium]|nr:tRNA (adenosine(37)-N6)-threonylcarbamoyltransferase complex ATPase subunit type 1 TsaE [Patescibacteria group bacterium]